ncbi:(2Fe-2S)-binding protein [Echinicola sediminis]
MAKFTLTVNKKPYHLNVSPDTPLLWVLRDHLNLLGTKFGCGMAMCGACTVHIEGRAIRSCVYPVSQIGDQKITTIEGLGGSGLHPVQEAWIEEDVAQCGYCQAGQIMTASAFLNNNPSPTSEEIRNAMHGNICRCASYNRIEKAVAKAAKKLR